MFTIAVIIFFLLGCIPLLITLRTASGRPEEAFRSSLRRAGPFMLADSIIIALFITFGSIITDHFQFRRHKNMYDYGHTLTSVNEFKPQGDRDLLIRNIPFQVEPEKLSLKKPGIYYREFTDDYEYTGTMQKDLHYPSGDEHVYTDYDGGGIDSFFRLFSHARRFDDYRSRFSGYYMEYPCFLFKRNILDRVHTLAPFQVPDRDPYALIRDDGQVEYTLEAHSGPARFPYSEKYIDHLQHLSKHKDIRDSVHCVIDAFDGSVVFHMVISRRTQTGKNFTKTADFSDEYRSPTSHGYILMAPGEKTIASP